MEEPAFVAAVGSLTGMRVSDLGCGDGTTARTIMGLGAATYLGFDGSAGMIDAARERHAMPGVTFVQQDIEDLSLAARSFDLVASRMAFHYIESLGPVLDRISKAFGPAAGSSSRSPTQSSPVTIPRAPDRAQTGPWTTTSSAVPGCDRGSARTSPGTTERLVTTSVSSESTDSAWT